MNNLDDMMAMWKEMDNKLSAIVNENRRLAEDVKKSNLRSSQERLMRKYRFFIILETVMIPCFFLIIAFNPLVIEAYRWPTLIYYVFLLLSGICVDGYLLYRLNSMDFYKDSLKEISDKARENWKIHKISVIFGMPLAIGAVILFCFAVGCNEETLMGVCVGAAIGLAIGLNVFFKFMKNYNSMMRLE